jgi:hypothetical protein
MTQALRDYSSLAARTVRRIVVEFSSPHTDAFTVGAMSPLLFPCKWEDVFIFMQGAHFPVASIGERTSTALAVPQQAPIQIS